MQSKETMKRIESNQYKKLKKWKKSKKIKIMLLTLERNLVQKKNKVNSMIIALLNNQKTK